MEDPLRLSDEQFRHVYANAFETWARLYDGVCRNSKLPACCFLTQDTLPLPPTFPRNLNLRNDYGRLNASGFSVLGSSPAKCVSGISSFQEPKQLNVTVKDPVLLSTSESALNNCYSESFTSRSDYTTILMLAWAYILSARWAEIMPSPCSLDYTDSQARPCNTTTRGRDSQYVQVVDIRPTDLDEARWWAAILAPGQGWRATIQSSFLSPWSVRIESSSEFFLPSEVKTSPSKGSAATFLEACGFLKRFCIRHNIVDQSHAALAAVLLFPYKTGQTLQVPCFRLDEQEKLHEESINHNESDLLLHSIYDGQHLDRLLTLSCNTWGISSLLLSVFYEPSIECNAATPWLQGTLAAIECLVGENPAILGRMCMERAPEVAFLWLGGTILGLQKQLLQQVYYGQLPVDLHSAMWSGVILSFLQQPVTEPVVANDYIQRADECRLLYLSQSDRHTYMPVSPWKPLGQTCALDVDIEVRNHAECTGHQLQYQGFIWDCTEGEPVLQLPNRHIRQHQRPLSTQGPQTGHPVVWNALNRSREAISENATRNTLGWLRPDGYSRREKDVYKHEWFAIWDSDDEEELPEEEVASSKGNTNNLLVEEWLCYIC